MDTKQARPVYALLLMLSLAAGLSGCNTMEGAGQDIERAGDAIEDEARERK